MLYVVSGFKRTGTSMMMHALIAGGLDGVYSEQRQHITDKIPEGEYNPNPNGFYECVSVNPQIMEASDGKVIKVFGKELVGMQHVFDNGLRVVYMTRPFDDVIASLRLLGGKKPKAKPIDQDRIDKFAEDQAAIVKLLNNRKDIKSLTVLSFYDVVEYPRTHFEILAEGGWPIDPDKCAAAVNPNYVHVREGKYGL